MRPPGIIANIISTDGTVTVTRPRSPGSDLIDLSTAGGGAAAVAHYQANEAVPQNAQTQLTWVLISDPDGVVDITDPANPTVDAGLYAVSIYYHEDVAPTTPGATIECTTTAPNGVGASVAIATMTGDGPGWSVPTGITILMDAGSILGAGVLHDDTAPINVRANIYVQKIA